jgi:hypothetical protein
MAWRGCFRVFEGQDGGELLGDLGWEGCLYPFLVWVDL